jgi:CO dehydrogenase/acetyl-CoA synthase gamma subunit (corrinoid Fe-S protein)
MALQSVATKATPDLKEVHDLLVEADSIIKVCSYYDVEDLENAVVRCALSGASRLLNEAMQVTGNF